MPDLSLVIQIAKSAAELAGDFLNQQQNKTQTILVNEGRDIKLELDIQVEKKIKEYISSRSQYPILGEESGLSGSMEQFYWVIDPLDGTSNFLRGIPVSCVSIALMNELNPILGVIFDFNNDHMYFGHEGSKSFLNNVEIKVSSIRKKKDATLMTGIPAKDNYSDNEFQNMINDFQEWKKIRMIGSAAMAAVYVAAGRAEAYKEAGIFLWDIAAGAAIVKAAGGKYSISNLHSNYRVDAEFSNNKLL